MNNNRPVHITFINFVEVELHCKASLYLAAPLTAWVISSGVQVFAPFVEIFTFLCTANLGIIGNRENSAIARELQK